MILDQTTVLTLESSVGNRTCNLKNKGPPEITSEKDKKDETGMMIKKWLEEKPIWRQIKGACGFMQFRSQFNRLYIKEPVKSFVGMFRKMKISLYDN